MGAGETFGLNLESPGEIKAALLTQTLTAVERMRRAGYLARTVTVKFRDGQFQTSTRAKTLARPSDLREEVYKAVLEIYEKEAPRLGPMRLLGVSLSRLCRPEEAAQVVEPPRQRSLFEVEPEEPAPQGSNEKSAKLNKALDLLSGRFGRDMVRPATLADKKPREEN